MAHALHASAELFGRVVDETFIRRGVAVQLGNSPALGVPVPAGEPWLARARWLSGSVVTVLTPDGQDHRLTPEQNLVLQRGPVTLTLALVKRYPLQRTAPFPWQSSLAWFVLLLASTLVVGQLERLWELRCMTVPIFERYAEAPPLFLHDCYGAGDSGGETVQVVTAEYLARLLQEDYEGEEQGAIDLDMKRESFERKAPQIYLPAGADGPRDEMGGAADVTPEPVRSPKESEEPPIEGQEDSPLLLAEEEQGAVVELDLPDSDGQADAEDRDSPPPPSEEKEGWGIPDWYDAQDEQIDNMEIEVMLRYAQQQLRIDPNDPYALSVLSYYQYLAEDYEGALQTYNRFVELYPQDPAGYNNMALVYKRLGDYDREQGLYHVALALQPNDDTALNNLAVNLAHKGQIQEALEIMERLETLLPDDPYADLHRAKIYAAAGDQDQALALLEKALEGMKTLDTLHHIEFRQDIRVDPVFEELRQTRRFRAILWKYYGDDTPIPD